MPNYEDALKLANEAVNNASEDQKPALKDRIKKVQDAKQAADQAESDRKQAIAKAMRDFVKLAETPEDKTPATAPAAPTARRPSTAAAPAASGAPVKAEEKKEAAPAGVPSNLKTAIDTVVGKVEGKQYNEVAEQIDEILDSITEDPNPQAAFSYLAQQLKYTGKDLESLTNSFNAMKEAQAKVQAAAKGGK
jgi:hypothetical protein